MSFREALQHSVDEFQKGQIWHPLDSVDPNEHEDWLESVNHLDPLACDRDSLQGLIDDAPNEAVTAWLLGIMETRVRIAFITGTHF